MGEAGRAPPGPRRRRAPPPRRGKAGGRLTGKHRAVEVDCEIRRRARVLPVRVDRGAAAGLVADEARVVDGHIERGGGGLLDVDARPQRVGGGLRSRAREKKRGGGRCSRWRRQGRAGRAASLCPRRPRFTTSKCLHHDPDSNHRVHTRAHARTHADTLRAWLLSNVVLTTVRLSGPAMPAPYSAYSPVPSDPVLPAMRLFFIVICDVLSKVTAADFSSESLRPQLTTSTLSMVIGEGVLQDQIPDRLCCARFGQGRCRGAGRLERERGAPRRFFATGGASTGGKRIGRASEGRGAAAPCSR
jgi:hypothetical protein